ncbi:peptidoglycan DD-metalloendopeptidase family protein [Sulfurirhabdus autotrophica]|uniref:LysM domain-containing protein n=1 Tax=Sulfurirhabdus autotrophica TaxID=1706046 RepID=A0A4R3XT38_9PROT|nr:peptidoglycan DD-metalloendopeptidase family protein [Sulfurirhabdus autotrophica]TCV81087.1 LysM domain-containing protein [Sulfurirhabdus autotrophica]
MIQQPIYTVKSGDTLWGISHKTGVDINHLAKINNLHGKALHTLRIGQTITLPATTALHDTTLDINILDLTFKPIKNAHLKLEYDGDLHEVTANSNGVVSNIHINDHAQGLKVQFRGIDGKYILIAEHKTLPLGRKLLTLTSREVVLKGAYYAKPGAQRQTKTSIKHEIVRANNGVHIKPKGATPKPDAALGAAPTSVNKETRVEGGIPVQVAATIFTEGNLLLSPGNEKYRKLILASAQRYGFTPHTLAALIDAEASKSKDTWEADSFNKSTNAAGLTQFLRSTWLEMMAEPRSLMNQRLKQEQKFDKIIGELDSSGEYCLYSVKGSGKNQIKEELSSTLIANLLKWRFTPEYAIDTAALYGKINLEKLAKRGLNVASLAPEDLAKVMYLAHHEGAGGAVAVIKGTLDDKRAKKNLPKQVGNIQAASLFARFKDNHVEAYSYWLYTYTDSKINVAHFMVKSAGVAPKNAAKIAETLGAPIIPKPAEKVAAKAPALLTKAGASEGWHDPLDSCTLRTAKLASVKSATFGMVRNGGKKAHQGIDLKADPGTPIYAVANGKVVAFSHDVSPGKGYGRTITLAVDIQDLQKKQRDLVLAKKADAEVVYFFYAHLKNIDANINVNKNAEIAIAKGTIIGTTGDTGNANGMDTISNGAHLHFEVRLEEHPRTKLLDRLDPKPFINQCN